jgi:ankyrin repeat protein
VTVPDLPLIAAAGKGQLEEVRRLLAAGHDPNERGQPLTEKEMKAAKWILNEGGAEMAAESMGRTIDITPLMAAAEGGHAEIIEALLAAGADVNAEDSFKRRAIMFAIRWKHEGIARRLLESGSDPNAKDLDGDPVLTQAIHARLWPIANALLDSGALPQPRGKKDSMPLAVASYRCGKDGVPLLLRMLDMGAKPAGPQFLANIIQAQAGDVVRRVLRDFAELTSGKSHDELLELAGKRREVEIIKALIDCGIRPQNSAEGQSPLAGVIIGPPRSSVDFYKPEYINDPNEIACLEALVNAGADLNRAEGAQSVPLHWAIYFCRAGLCRWLLDHGADPSIIENGESLLQYAKKKCEEISPEDWDDDEEQQAELVARKGELQKIITMLTKAGGAAPARVPGAEAKAKVAATRRRPSRLQQSLNIEATPVAKRRGVCDPTFSKAEQILIRADIDKIADMFANDKKVERVERDACTRLKDIQPSNGDVIALVKLKGHDWVYFGGRRRSYGDSPMKAWSKKLKAPVLCAGEQSTAGVVYYMLYDSGKCVESFESDGVWFHGGVEIDPEIQDESDRMVGTTFMSERREPDSVEWSAYESEYEFLDRFLRDEDAYLTFLGISAANKGRTYELWSFHKDETASEAIERVDLVLYKPTPQQEAAAAQPDPKTDALLQAIEKSDKAAVAAAIAAGADVNGVPPGHSYTYLVQAIGRALINEDESIVDMLLEAGADPVHGGAKPVICRVADWSGTRAITLRVMHKLIQLGADVNAREAVEPPNPFMPSGKTPLMEAAQSAKLNYVKLLLRHGADPALKDSGGRAALDYAEVWLREVKKDRLKDVPSFTDETSELVAKESVELLEAAIEGRLDLASLPSFDELIAAETALVAAKRRRR